MPSRTIDSVLKDNNGIGLGFGFLRLALAMLILFWHCFALSYGIEWSIATLHGPYRYFIMLLVPAFFSLSGFLVAASLLRQENLRVFLLFRVLRILPALVTETMLSAFVLGVLATSLPLAAYLRAPDFTAYMLNILGIVHFQLPGVFDHNPWPSYVNFSLWTLPAELYCYMMLAVLMLAGIHRERRLLLGVFLLCAAGLAFVQMPDVLPQTSSNIFSRPMLLCCFASGNLLYFWRERVRLSPVLLVLSLLCYAFVIYIFPPLAFLLGSAAIAYATVYIGLSRLPKIPLLMRGDYSYGIYLYSYPIQQTVVWLFPSLRQYYWVFLIAAPATVLFAMFSYHCIEKPALSLRKRFTPQR